MTLKSFGLVSVLASLAIVGYLFVAQSKEAGPTSQTAQQAQAGAAAGAADTSFQAAAPVLQAAFAQAGTYAGAAVPILAALAEAGADVLELGVPFSATGVRLLLEDPRADTLLASAEASTDARLPLLVRLGIVRDRLRDHPRRGHAAAVDDDDGAPSDMDVAAALLAWAPAASDLPGLRSLIAERRGRLAELRRDDAPLSLSTAHGTKGLEFDEVVGR